MKKIAGGAVRMKAAAMEWKASVKEGKETRRQRDYHAVVGLDLGDRQTYHCVLDLDGELAVESAVATQGSLATGPV